MNINANPTNMTTEIRRSKVLRLILYVSFFIVIVSCQSRVPETSLPLISLSGLSFSKDEVLLSDFASQISYFPLETIDASLVSEIHDACFTDSTIAVFDYNLSVVQLFSMQGMFLKKLNDHLKAGADSSRIHQLVYNKQTKQILLYSKGRMIHSYSSNGDYLYSQHFENVIPFYIYPTESNLLLYFPYPRSLGFDNYDFGIANSTFQITKRLGYRKVTWRPKEKDMVFFPNVYGYADTLCFWNRYCDTVFGFFENHLIPRFVVTGSNLKTARENYLQIQKTVTDADILIYKIFESRDFLFFECVKNRSRCHLVVRKDDHLAKEIKQESSIDPFTIRNDIDGGYPFWPDRATSDYMLMFVSADRLVKFLSSSAKESGGGLVTDNHSRAILGKLAIQDNPVIIKIDLKK
ncbi:MAG: 6-bladed beta-propeller [Bacteroidales bacterium]